MNSFYTKAFSSYEKYDTTIIEGLLENHYSIDSNTKQRIINWLSLFNEKSIENSSLEVFMKSKGYSIEKLYRAILECLSIHKSLFTDDISWFKEKIKFYNETKNYIIFPLKAPFKDINGLSRLFDKCKLEKRNFNLDAYKRELSTTDCKDKSIVIVADISISGTQTKKALKYYMNNYQDNNEFINATKEKENNNEKYFNIGNLNELKKLQENIKKNKLIFISPIMTEEFKENVKNSMVELNIGTSSVQWEYHQLLTSTDYLFGKAKLNNNNYKLLTNLLEDRELISKVFEVEGQNYKNSINDIKNRNTILRVGSLPTKHIRLFTLKPKNGSKPLLDYVGNWKRRKVN